MEIRDMFLKPINRDLKGVIKVGQDDDTNIQQELEEYVVTRELQKHFRTFFDSYKNAGTYNTDKMGVWISGFFGSGKSHFLKILSYLLENKVVNGKTAFAYFEEDEKVKDNLVLADMRVASNFSTDVILFNIDAKSQQGSKQDKDAIINVFLKVFNEMQGFCGTIPFLADLEKRLTEEGRYEEFKTKFEYNTGSVWTEARHDFDFIQDDIVDVLVDMQFMSEEAARNWCERSTQEYTISIETFAERVKKYIASKGKNHHVAFLVDEVGQYIGDDSQLMLNLQTVTECLGTACRGKVWIIVTSQQDIDSITKTKGNDFSKIQGRFDTRLSLSSANVDEVIRERILKKHEAAKEALSRYYDDKETIIKNLIAFNDGVEKKLYANRNVFADVYPFIPYQFELLGSVLTAIRMHGASGKHLAEGERSMLALFKDSAERIMNKDMGELVPFHMFYDALEQFLDHSHKGVISRAYDNEYLNPHKEEDCFTVNVLKTLFMIKYVKEIKANVENLTSLMISNVADDRMGLKQKVEEALKRLVSQTLVQKNNDIYVFLTDEEQEVSLAVKRTPVEQGEITLKVAELVFEDLYGEKKYSYPMFTNRYAFGFNQIVDDKIYKPNSNNAITLKIITPNNSAGMTKESIRLEAMQSNCVLVVLPDDRSFLDEVKASLQIEKFLRMDNVNSIIAQDHIKTAKKTELTERKKTARLWLEEALKTADIYIGTDSLQSTSKDIKTRFTEALGKLVQTVFHKLSYIDTAMSEADTHKLLADNGRQLSLMGNADIPNKLALNDVNDFIKLNASRYTKTSMKSLLDRFTKAPYGFIEADVQWLVAKLFKDEQITLEVNSEQVSLTSHSVEEVFRYITRKEYNERLMTDKRTRATDKQKRTVKDVAKELFNISNLGDSDDEMMRKFLGYSNDLKQELERLEVKQVAGGKIYPGKEVTHEGKKLLTEIIVIKNTNNFFEHIYQNQDACFVFAEDYEPVKNFFNSEQIQIFDKALRLLEIYNNSKTYIVNQKLEEIVKKVEAIITDAKPYEKIFNLPLLLADYQSDYLELLEKVSLPAKAAVDEAKTKVMEYITGKLCESALRENFFVRFSELHKKIEECHDIAILHTIKFEADALKIRCMNEIDTEEAKLQAQKEAEANTQADTAKPADEPLQEVVSKPVIKKQRTVSIKTINAEHTWRVENEADVKKYIAELEKKLLAELEQDTILNIEF